MIKFQTIGGTPFSLSGTRLTELLSKRKGYRYVKLSDLKKLFTSNFSRGDTYVGEIETTFNSNAHAGRYTVRYGYFGVGFLSIGCMGFSKRTTNKILRAAGIKLTKTRALAATAGV